MVITHHNKNLKNGYCKGKCTGINLFFFDMEHMSIKEVYDIFLSKHGFEVF